MHITDTLCVFIFKRIFKNLKFKFSFKFLLIEYMLKPFLNLCYFEMPQSTKENPISYTT